MASWKVMDPGIAFEVGAVVEVAVVVGVEVEVEVEEELDEEEATAELVRRRGGRARAGRGEVRGGREEATPAAPGRSRRARPMPEEGAIGDRISTPVADAARR